MSSQQPPQRPGQQPPRQVPAQQAGRPQMDPLTIYKKLVEYAKRLKAQGKEVTEDFRLLCT